MDRPAVMVQHLSKRFGDRTAFDDVSFEVGQGEVFGFLGPNGAGKTSTVRTLGTSAPSVSIRTFISTSSTSFPDRSLPFLNWSRIR